MLLWRYTEDIYGQSLPTESWPDGMKKKPKTTTKIPIISQFMLLHSESGHVFSEQEPWVQLNPKAGWEETLFYLYTG